ncbi:DUF6001 family protein [Streptomyces sp. AC550_RSS872]|uniref:DUF6001 family protein n=1 Tax=Streptomyces sp. AC550_RSS872 TaxID=2823689 RepID=UPI001C2654FA|nr:DUF6001 family protein [Streptomyces sp. AC550_RSS872]
MAITPETRLRHVDTFLASRGLTPGGLESLLTGRTGPARHFLLTSSPVHGLANATSDVDFIRIQCEPMAGARMATQLFEGPNHLEAISFAEEEAAAALADLRALADADPRRSVLAYRGWDKQHELRRKYLERMVNGVALDRTLPYLDHLPELARLWKWSSLHTATEQVLFLSLAEAAGERRGRVGYAVNALLHLMDAVLSHHLDVYSNRKWFLLRWTRFREQHGTEPVVAAVDALRAPVSEALAGKDGGPLAPALTALLTEVYAAAGEGHPPTLAVEPVGEPVRQRFLPGADMLLGASTTFLGQDPLPTGAIPFADLPEGVGAPADLLRAARAGAVTLLPV